MTQTLVRPQPRPAAARRKAARQPATASPLWLRSLVAAVWSVAVGLAVLVVVALIVWAADSRTTSSAGAAMRFAVAVWLAAQRAPLHVPGGEIAVAPLGLTVVLAALLARFAAVLSRDASSQEPGAVAAMVLAVSFPYAGIVTGLAALARTDQIRPSIEMSFLTGLGFALVVTTVGGMRGAGLWRPGWQRLPDDARAGVAAAGVAAAALLGCSAALTVAALIRDHKLIGDSLSGYGNGAGQFTIALLCLWLVPNAVLFTASYLTGTGFVVGAGQSVTLGAAHVGATPALPILAAVPRGSASWPVVMLAFAAVGGAAVLAAWRVRRNAGPDLLPQLRAAGVLAVTAGAGMAALAGLAGGPAGPGRLAVLGPSPWQVGLSFALEVAVPVVLFVVGQAWWRMWRSLPGQH